MLLVVYVYVYSIYEVCVEEEGEEEVCEHTLTCQEGRGKYHHQETSKRS